MTGQGEVDVAIMLHDLAETGVARNALAIASSCPKGWIAHGDLGC